MWRIDPQKLPKTGGAAEEMGFIISKSSLRGGLQSDVAISINIRHPPTCGARRWGSYTKLKAIHSYFYWRITFATLFRSCRVMTFFIFMTSSLWLVSLEASRKARHPLPPKIIGNIKYPHIQRYVRTLKTSSTPNSKTY